MSNPNNNNSQQDDTQNSQIQEGQGQEATKEVVSNPEPENKPEPKAEPKKQPKAEVKPKKEDNLVKFKNENKELQQRLAEIEKNLETEKLERVKQTAINQALELGLNPEKRKVFEKYHLSHLTNADDVNQALAEFKDEMPEFFSKPKVNLTNSPSGGGGNGTDIATKEQLAKSGNAREIIKYK